MEVWGTERCCPGVCWHSACLHLTSVALNYNQPLYSETFESCAWKSEVFGRLWKVSEGQGSFPMVAWPKCSVLSLATQSFC